MKAEMIGEILGGQSLGELLQQGTKVDKRTLFTRVLPRAAVGTVALLLLKSEQARGADTSVIPFNNDNKKEMTDLFGVDDITGNQAYWTATADGGAKFLGTGDGVNHPVNTSHLAEMITSTRLTNPDGSEITVNYAVNRSLGGIFAAEATLYRHNNPADAWSTFFINNFLAQQSRSGSLVLPVNAAGAAVKDTFTYPYAWKSEPASLYGMDSVSQNGGLWTLLSDNGAKFTGDGFSHLFSVRDAEAIGYNQIKTRGGLKTMLFVSHRQVGFPLPAIDLTTYRHRNMEPGFTNLYNGAVATANADPNIKGAVPIRF